MSRVTFKPRGVAPQFLAVSGSRGLGWDGGARAALLLHGSTTAPPLHEAPGVGSVFLGRRCWVIQADSCQRVQRRQQ